MRSTLLQEAVTEQQEVNHQNNVYVLRGQGKLGSVFVQGASEAVEQCAYMYVNLKCNTPS